MKDRAGFKAWQENTAALFQAAREEDLARINEEFRDVLEDYELSQAEHAHIIDKMDELMKSHPKSSFSWETTPEIMEAHARAMGEMESVNVRFYTKWGNRYEEYLAITDALEKEIKKAIDMTKSYVNYKMAMKRLARQKDEGGEPHD